MEPNKPSTESASNDSDGESGAPQPVPELLRAGIKPMPTSASSPKDTPAAENFRPPRGPSAWTFFSVAAVLAGGGTAAALGYLDGAFSGNMQALALAGWIGGGVFALLSAWAFGRRLRVDDEALLVHLAAGETGEALMVTSAQGRVYYANKAFRSLFKGSAAAEIPTGLRLADNDEEGAETIARLLAAANGGAHERAEVAFQARGTGLGGSGGGTEWWRLSVRPAGRGKTGLIAWSAGDITARRELDEVRRREEALLADLLDNLPVGFFSVDGTGRVAYANETLCGWLGIGLRDIREQGLTFADFVLDSADHEEDADGASGQVTLQPHLGEAFRAYLMQSGRVGDDGELLYTRSVVVRNLVRKPAQVESTVAPVPSDEIDNQAVEAIARKLYWLFDEAPVAIALLDLRANFTDCNGAFLKMLGLHKDDVLNQPFIDRLAKEDRGEINAQLSKVVMGIMRAAHLEVRMSATGGREVTASLSASRMEDAFGEVIGLIVHFIDTTEQKHLEVQFAQSQKMQSIGQLAGGIAHDFNNLLTAMIGFSDLLLARHGPGDPSFSDIDQIRQNAVRATALVRQLLAFSRKQTLAPQEVDVREKLSDLSEVLNRLLGATIELNIEHDRDVWHVRVDPVQFDQVILNLAVNARDAMPGGGTLTVRTSNLSLDEPTQRGMELVPAGEYVTIDVIDTGEGIRKEDIARIFEPFFSTKEVGEGTGLGLSTVYGIVHQTGGHILVDSAPGEGTAFTVCLPRFVPHVEVMALDSAPQARAGKDEAPVLSLVHGQEPEPAAEPEPAVSPMEEEKQGEGDLTGVGVILLVEDEDAVRMFGSRALRNKGYTVLEAANGEEALEVINATEATIDLIVTDVVMPGMDGHTFVQFVRQEMPQVKVIFISGFAENVIPGGITPESGFEFLPKPFSLKDLAAKVKDVLAK